MSPDEPPRTPGSQTSVETEHRVVAGWTARYAAGINELSARVKAEPQGQELRIGLDFGTSTTLVAVRLGNRPPRVLRLEGTSNAMPSYIADVNGQIVFGQSALTPGSACTL